MTRHHDLRLRESGQNLREVGQEFLESGQALADIKVRYQLLVDSVTDYAIYMLDPEGRVVTWNAGAERLKGYTAEEALGRDYSVFFPPEDAETGLPAQELATAAREGHYEIQAWRQRKDGTKFWALVTLTAILGPEGELCGFANVTRDMTQQKRLEDSLAMMAADLEGRVAERTRELEATVAELQRKNQEVEAFVYIVSHDLRAPLVNVQGFVRELEESCKHLKRSSSPA
jgi:PAS domain S-box-containing protein